MRIACVHCGERSSAEFTYLGDASPRRPEGPVRDVAAMFDYVYTRENPAGFLREYWQHTAGCRAWLVVERDVTTHVIAAVQPAGAGRTTAAAGRTPAGAGRTPAGAGRDLGLRR